MLYQLLLCLLQTAITLYVTMIVGVKYPKDGLLTPWMIADLGITMLLITYASDMLSLWVSTLAKTTTTAMTIMPFVLIFQLVFSGGMLTLPAWTEPLTAFTISNPGLKAIAAQADTNHRPFVTISNMVGRMRDSEIRGEITLGQALDALSDAENPAVAQLRAIRIGETVTPAQIKEMLDRSAAVSEQRKGASAGGDALDALEQSGLFEAYGDQAVEVSATVGELVDRLAANPDVQAHRDDSYAFSTTVGGLIDIAGEDAVKTFLEDKAAEASYKPEYEQSVDRIVDYWLHLLAFIAAFALLSTVTLEFIDKDKR